MFNIVLYEPEIPPNTGNIIRLASNTGCCLHLIEPLGFSLDNKQMRRAGLDYHEYSEIRVHKSWNAFLETRNLNRIFALSTKGETRYDSVNFSAGDTFLFGPETRGLPADVRTSDKISCVLKLPMCSHSRSLNLSNSVAVVVYEAWRQQNFAPCTRK